MVAFNKYQSFIEAVFEGKHDFGTDTFKIALTNTAPNAATHTQLSDITEITPQHGYPSGGTAVTVTSSSQTGGTYSWVVTSDVVFTGDGGSFGPCRYAVLYNDDATNDELVGWWDYGSSVTVQDTEPFNVECEGETVISAS